MSAVPSPPSPAPGPTPPSGRRTGRRRLGVVLLVVLGVLAALCFGGLGFAYLVYDRATQPDRSTPTVVVDQYVESTFNDRDPGRAKLFLCSRHRSMTEPQQLLTEIESREKQFSTRFTVTTADIDQQIHGSSAQLTASLRLTTPVSRSTQQWRFDLTRESGWRICDAHKVG